MNRNPFRNFRGYARMGLSACRLFFVAAVAVTLPLAQAPAETAATHDTAANLGGWLAPSARDLRVFRQDALPGIALISIFGTIGLLAIFYLLRGRVRLSLVRSGRKVPRFNFLERIAHWLTAGSFVILALTGLNKTFGRQTVLRLMSPEGFGELSRAAREIHYYTSFAFSAGLLLAFVLWARDNIPSRLDITWLAAGGGLLGGRKIPAGRFNGGQKIVFWSIVLGGTVLSATGYSLMFPDAVLSGPGMRLASMIHGLLAALLMSLMIAHAYIGSLGIEGAIQGIVHGSVDVNWARQHHELWARQFVDEDNEPKMTDRIEPIENRHTGS
jgi:formate dehydrogenase subunit gamma